MAKFKKLLCIALSVCMISLPFAVPMTVSGTEDIDSLEEQLEELEKQNEEYEAILEQTQSDINEKEEYKEALVKKVEVLDDKIMLTRQKIDDLNANIKDKQAEVDKANADIDTQLDALSNRLRAIYMAGNANDIEIILGAKDFSDFIDKVQLVKTLSNYDKELIEEIKVELEKISEQKAALEKDKTELETEKQELESNQQDFNDLISENDEILRNLYASSDDAKDALEHAALQNEEIESKIQAYYASQRKQQQQKPDDSDTNPGGNTDPPSGGYTPSPTPPASGWTWPVPGYYGYGNITSFFGEDRDTYAHGAIDIAGSGIMGSTVVAAADGYVIAANNTCPHNWGKYGSCGCGGGFGNYVMIDHGNGKTAIYAHLTNAVLSPGQSVSQGQVVGYVGSTGYSTGAHLHFETRLNGVKYDPLIEYGL